MRGGIFMRHLDRLPVPLVPIMKFDLLRYSNLGISQVTIVEQVSSDAMNGARNAKIDFNGIRSIGRPHAGPTIGWVKQVPKVAVIQLGSISSFGGVGGSQMRVITTVVVHDKIGRNKL